MSLEHISDEIKQICLHSNTLAGMRTTPQLAYFVKHISRITDYNTDKFSNSISITRTTYIQFMNLMNENVN